MDIFHMSLSASLLIIVIVLIRAVGINKLPKKTFLVLWGVVILRLFIPFNVPSSFSIYSIFDQIAGIWNPGTPVSDKAQPIVDHIFQTGILVDSPIPSEEWTISFIYLIWIVVAAGMGIFFAVVLYKNLRELNMALPIRHHAILDEWRDANRRHHTVQVLVSDRITTPISAGILKPRIILPKTMDINDNRLMRYVLAHEFQHIKHYDAVWKLILVAALCCHWFNPLVWVMFFLAHRDLEMACDEKVLKSLGEQTKSDYALSLIQMAEQRSKFTPLYNGFSKNATEERIVSIMKYKKASFVTIVCAFVLVAGVATAFATSSNGVESIESKETSVYNDPQHEPGYDYPPHTAMERQGMKDFAEFLQYDETLNLWRFDGSWVRTLYDENIWQGKIYSGIARIGPGAPRNWGKPIDLKTVRNPETNKVEKLVEMTAEETEQLVNQLIPE